MTEQVKRYEFFSYIDDDVAELDCHEADDGTWINAADYARLEQECERLRLDNLSKNGSMKAFGAQIAALQRAVKNRDKLKDRAEQQRDIARKVLAKCQEKLDPHRDAALFGEVCDALRGKANTSS